MTSGRRRILLLGSGGYVGREIGRRLATGHDVTPTHRSEAHFPGSRAFDIFRDDPARLADGRFDVVVCAARVFDETADRGPDAPSRKEAFLRLLARFAGTRFLFMSSDAVFSGDDGLYGETAGRAPRTPYGQRMRLFEDQVSANVPDHCIVRASYIFGYAGDSLDKRLSDSMLRLSRGDRLEFFDDMYRSPVEVGQVAEAVCTLALAEHVGAVHVAGPRMSVYEFQHEALAALGADTGNVHPTAMPADSPLPRDTSLRTDLMARLTGVAPQSIARSLARC